MNHTGVWPAPRPWAAARKVEGGSSTRRGATAGRGRRRVTPPIELHGPLSKTASEGRGYPPSGSSWRPTRRNDPAAPRSGGRAGLHRSRLRVPRAQPKRRGGFATSPRPILAARSRPVSSATRSTKRSSSDSPTSIWVTPRSCSGASTATPRRPDTESFHIGRLPWPTSSASRSWSTGGRPSPSRSTVRRARTDGPRAAPPLRGRGPQAARHRGRAVRRRPPRCRSRRRPRPER